MDKERAGASSTAGGAPRPGDAGVDALIVTALHDELEAVLALGDGGRDGWREARDRAGFPYYAREIPNDRGEPLRVAAAWSGRMGESAAAARAQALIDELDPGCLAMCGICAGKRGEVALGDVIVADRVYSYDEGKRVAPDGAAGGGFFHDIETYNLERTWNMDAALFARAFEKSGALAAARPPPKASQARWLLHALYASQLEDGKPPVADPERAARCPGWAERLGELEAEGLVRIGDAGLELTDAGIKRVRRDRVIHPDGPPAQRPFRVHIGPIATGKAVQEDPGLFDRLKFVGRKALGVEMEAAAIGYVAERLGRRAIIAKAVSDHGDHDKDDSYRAFACRASAEFLITFLRRQLRPAREEPPARRGRLRRTSGRRAADRDDILLTDGRSDDFLSRVERVCRLREPEGAQIEWFDAPLPFGCYLRVSVREGGIVRIAPLGAMESGISTEAVSTFVETIADAYRRDDPGVVSTLVYGGEPAPEELVRYAAESRVRLVRFLEYQGLIEFRGYLAWQTARIERDPAYPPALYVDQRISLTVGQDETLRENALDAFAELLDAEHGRFVLVLGDFGTGKTFLLHELARRMARAGGPVTPVLIEMRALEKARDLNALIAQHLAIAGMERIDLAAFRHMLAEGRIALLFDGFDELALRVTYDRAVEHFDTLIQAAQGKAAKVVVTSRSQHFLSERQVKTALAERAALVPGYRLAKLEPFTEAQIRQALVHRLGGGEAADARLRLLADVRDLLGLSANPRMLGFIADIEEAQLRIAKKGDGAITSAGLYKLLLDRWLVWEYERAHPRGAQPGLSVAQRWWAVTELAMRLWERGERSVSVRELSPKLIEALQALGKHELDVGVAQHQIGSGTLLVWDEDENFRFIHQSVLEWLVARAAADELSRSGEAPALAEREISDLLADFFGALAGRDAAAHWVRSAASGALGAAAAANALRIDARMGLGAWARASLAGADLRGHDLSGRDLSRCDLRRADLREAKLAGADLTGATLAGACLDGADLSGATLAKADLTGASAVRARLLGADLQGATLASANLRGAKLVGARGAVLDGCDSFGAAPPEVRSYEPTWLQGGECNAVAVSPDGTLLASGHGGGIVLWDLAAGVALRVLSGHTDAVESIAFSGEGDTLASASADSSVCVWDVPTGNLLCTLNGHTRTASSVVFSPDGKKLASGSYDGTVRVWNVASCSPLLSLEGSGNAVTAVAFSADGEMLASGSSDGSLRVWRAETGDPVGVLPGPSSWVLRLAFSADGRSLVWGARDDTLHLWRLSSGETEVVYRGDSGHVTSMAVSPDGELVSSGGDNGVVRLWQVRTGGWIHVPGGHSDAVTCMAFSPDGATLATGAHDRKIRLWQTSTGNLLRALEGHSHGIVGMALSPDGATLASSSADDRIQLWDVATGSAQRRIEGHRAYLTDMTFSPDCATLALGSHDSAVRLWHLGSDRVTALVGHAGHVSSVAFSPDGKLLASGAYDRTARLWDVATGALLRVLSGHQGGVRALAFSPDGSTLATGADDRTVRLWDAVGEHGERLVCDLGAEIASLAFSPDGSTLACGCFSSESLLLQVPTGEVVRSLRGHGGRVTSVRYSPSGALIASASVDQSVRLWDAQTGEAVGVLRGHRSRIVSLAFTPEGATLFSSSIDNTIRCWDVRTGACVAVLLKLPEGWVAFCADGRYKLGGNIAGGFWHAVNLCRFEPGELDDLVPGLRLADDESLWRDRPSDRATR